MEARSRSDYSNGNLRILIVCLLPQLMRSVILQFVSCQAPPYFSTLRYLKNDKIFGKKKIY